MKHRLITIIPFNSALNITSYKVEVEDDDDGAPLKELQGIVGGHIEGVPHFDKYEDKPCVAYCNEDGRQQNMTINRRATQLWLNQLGDGPFRYDPKLLGNIAIDQEEA